MCVYVTGLWPHGSGFLSFSHVSLVAEVGLVTVLVKTSKDIEAKGYLQVVTREKRLFQLSLSVHR